MSADILIVDDSLTVRMDLAEAFDEAGLEVMLCPTLASARDALSEHRYPVVLLDVVLPDGCGIDLLSELKGGREDDPGVIMLSAEAEVADRLKGLRTGADDYVAKPYDATGVVRRVRQLLSRNTRTSSPPIVVIEDSETFRHEVIDGLRRAGYSPHGAATGREGLRLVGDLVPAAVIVDGLLPDMHGAAVVRLLRMDPALQHVPCLFLTGADSHTDELSALEAGADAYVQKGADLALVQARLENLVRRPNGSRKQPRSLLGTKKLLLVTSEPEVAQLGRSLDHSDWDVVEVRTLAEARELLAVQVFDGILLSLPPEQRHTRASYERVRRSLDASAASLIILSRDDDAEAMLTAFRAGVDDWCAVAAGPELIEARLRSQIRRKQIENHHATVHQQLIARARELEHANEELEQFTYLLSHDFKEPLRMVANFVDLLAHDYGDRLDAQGDTYIRYARDGAQRMYRLLEDLFAYTRVRRGVDAFRHVRLDEALAAALAQLELLIQEHDCRLTSDPLPEVIGDASQLMQLFQNLVENAIKFRAQAPLRVHVSAKSRGEMWVVSVRDNGIGIEPAYHERIFGMFQRLHGHDEYAGTGIGLAIAKKIVQRHDGRIWVTSRSDDGATFHFTMRGVADETGQPLEA